VGAPRGSRGFLVLLILCAAGIVVPRTYSTTLTWTNGGTSYLKNSNWTTSTTPTAGVTAIIADGTPSNPEGWNSNTNPGASTFGDLDFVAGATNLVIGNYTTKTTIASVNITLGASTLNSVANTIMANTSGSSTITFEDDIAPSGDLSTETATTTYTLNNSANYIQETPGSGIIIDNVITGSGDSITLLGGGNATTTGGVLELGAGSANDVIGGVAPNAPTQANGGTFTGSATVESADVNGFTGGLTIGDASGTANAGVVKIDGANALPTAGTITVNPNSQLLLNGGANYGGSGQLLVLSGTGTPTTNGALATVSGNSSTWRGSIYLNAASSINVQGSTGALVISGTVGGTAPLQKTGAGTLTLDGGTPAVNGGFLVSAGTLVAANNDALDGGGVSVAGGTLGTTEADAEIGGSLSLSTGAIALNSSEFSLGGGDDFSMSGGTLDVTDDSGTVGSLSAGAGGTFSITSGVLDLGGDTWNYSDTYDILSGFGSGSVSGLTIDDYDSADYTASLSDGGVLSFTAVPEPATWATMVSGMAGLMFYQSRRRRGNSRQRD
jgi:autotransporter-associated beta strand protein